MKKALRYTAFMLLMLLLFLPALQNRLGLISEKPLNGAFIPAEKPVFTWKKWFSGEFQGSYDRFTEDHIGFRNSLIRLKNQLDFTFFREVNAEGVIVGKDDYLYEYDYVRDYIGKDFTGMEFARKKMMRAAFIQKFLKDSLGIDFIIVFEPGKASFYPENIPESYLRDKSDRTNYHVYRALADQYGVRYIDFNHYFLSLKPDAQYPLFPRYGTHWSVYGMSFAADSLINYIEKIKRVDLRDVRISGFEADDSPRDTDNDVELPLNLICPLPSQQFAYPRWEIDSVSGKYRPMVLAVADSYYWNLFNTRIPRHLFANEAFWYFNAKVYPDTYYKETWVKDLDVLQEIKKQDVIFLMVTERFMHKFDWQFIDMVYNELVPPWLTDPVYENMNRVVSFDPWFRELIIKAENERRPLEEIIDDEAKFLYFTEKKGEYLIDYGVEYYMNIIRNDDQWFAHITEKAGQNGITVEEQLRIDAEYVLKQNYPDLHRIHQQMESLVDEMESGFDRLDTLNAEAASWGCPLEGYLRRKAFVTVREQEIIKTENSIRSTPEWLSDVKAKADQKNIPLKQMIRMDAEYVWEQKMRVQ